MLNLVLAKIFEPDTSNSIAVLPRAFGFCSVTINGIESILEAWI